MFLGKFPNNTSTIRFDRFRKWEGGWVVPVKGCTVSDGVSEALKADFSNTLGKGEAGAQLDISASMSNAIYGDSETVQPASMRTLALIRAY